LGQLFTQKKAKLRHMHNPPLTGSVLGWAPFRRPIDRGWEIWAVAMSLDLQRIDWMPSPPLVPDDDPIDIGHLQRMTLGDAGLEREVLAMFAGQAGNLIGALTALPSDAPELAHKLKGSARAIGAFRVADAAQSLETVLAKGENPSRALAELDEAIVHVCDAIDAILRRS
jgi:HPt (histidine-containing phosphotransfer) domain-containing protein